MVQSLQIGSETLLSRFDDRNKFFLHLASVLTWLDIVTRPTLLCGLSRPLSTSSSVSQKTLIDGNSNVLITLLERCIGKLFILVEISTECILVANPRSI